MNYSARFLKCQSKRDSYWTVYDNIGNTVILKTVEEIVGPDNVDVLYAIIASEEFGKEILETIDILGVYETSKVLTFMEWDDDFYSDLYDDEYYPDTERSADLILPPKLVPKGKVGDGMICCKCKDYFPLVEPNQPDGAFKCYKCRNNL